MAANLTMVRIATKLDDLFNEKIDIVLFLTALNLTSHSGKTFE